MSMSKVQATATATASNLPMHSVNFLDLCRICTASTIDERTDVFSVEGRNKNLVKKISECLSLDIDENDRLPKIICYKCESHVESIIEFRNLSKNSQTMLWNCLNTANSRSTNRSFITDKVSNTGQSLRVIATTTGSNQTPGTLPSELTFSLQPSTNTSSEGNILMPGNGDLINSIIQAVGLQQPSNNYYTIKLDNKENTIGLQREQSKQEPFQINEQQLAATDVLEKIIRSKPNLKVTPIRSKDKVQLKYQQQQQPNVVDLPQQFTVADSAQTQQILQLQNKMKQKSIPQFTITTPTTTTTVAQSNENLLPSPNKKPKLNLLITTPSQNATLPNKTQFNTMPAVVQSPPKIQLQLPALAPLLQQYPGFSMSAPQNQASGSTFLPITIKDESSDQQIVAHIDAKNFMLPTYQLQMNLEPQITTSVDGQPVMHLAPSTLQIVPQPINNQNLQITATAALNALTGNTLNGAQLFTNAGNSTPSAAVQATQCNVLQSEPETLQHQQMKLPENVQITSQQIIKPPNIENRTILTTNVGFDASTINHNVKQSTQQSVQQKPSEPQSQTTLIKQQKYKITTVPGTNTIDVTPSKISPLSISARTRPQNDVSPPSASIATNLIASTSSFPAQFGNITLQRISNKATNSETSIVSNASPQKPVPTTTPTATKLLNNKNNVIISRVVTSGQNQKESQSGMSKVVETKLPNQRQQQQQQFKMKSEQQQQSQTNPTVQTSQTLKQSTVKKPAIGDANANIKAQTKPNAIVMKPPENPKPTIAKKSQVSGNSADKSTLKIEFVSSTPTAAATPPTTTTTSVKTVKSNNVPSTTPITNKKILKEKPNNNGGTEKTTSLISVAPLQCERCQRVFKKKEHLNQHRKLHTGQRPYQCSIDTCGKKFSRKEHLNRHLISHSGQKLFKCDVCKKPFSRKDNLNKHRKIHTDSNEGPNKFTCQKCKKCFAFHQCYKQHLATHEKTTPETPATVQNDSNNTASGNVEQKITQPTNNKSSANATRQLQLNRTNTQRQQQQQQGAVTQKPKPQQQRLLTQQQQKPQQPQQQQQQQRKLNSTSQQQQQHQQQSVNRMQDGTQQLQQTTAIQSIPQVQTLQNISFQLQQQPQQQLQLINQQQPQIVHVQLPGLQMADGSTGMLSIAQQHPTIQDVAGNTTVLNIPSHLASLVQSGQAQFVNSSTGQIINFAK